MTMVDNAVRRVEAAERRNVTKAPLIAGVARAMPAHQFSQETLTAELKEYWGYKLKEPERLERLHARLGVDTRYVAFPIERYYQFASWGEMNAAWLEAVEEVGARAIDAALGRAGMTTDDLDALFVVSITGIASPSLDARLTNRMRLRPDIKRTPIFGVGCAGGAVGLSRAADYTLAYPGHTAAILAVELCSLTIQRDDLSTANMIAAGLFGDGAAAALVAGARTAAGGQGTAPAGPRILANRSVFYPDSEDIMGWDISEKGFKIVLSARLPEMIREVLAADVDSFLAEHALRRGDIGSWIIHMGGPKVLDAIQDTLRLRDQDVERSWDCLRRFGNLSSASILLVLEDAMMNRRPAPGTLGMLLAMGPGFCSEMLLVRW